MMKHFTWVSWRLGGRGFGWKCGGALIYASSLEDWLYPVEQEAHGRHRCDLLVCFYFHFWNSSLHPHFFFFVCLPPPPPPPHWKPVWCLTRHSWVQIVQIKKEIKMVKPLCFHSCNNSEAMCYHYYSLPSWLLQWREAAPASAVLVAAALRSMDYETTASCKPG